MESVFGRNIGISNEATKNGNKSIAELKRESAAEKLKIVEENIYKSENMLENAQNEAEKYKDWSIP